MDRQIRRADIEKIQENANKLIGYVGARLVREQFDRIEGSNKFLVRLNNMRNESIVAIVNKLLELNEKESYPIQIKIPRDIGKGLDESCLTNLNPAGIRNLEQNGNATLTATSDTTLTDTMSGITAIESSNIKSDNLDLWIEASVDVLYTELTDHEKDTLKNALQALLNIDSSSSIDTIDFANFCSSINYYYTDESLDIQRAIGQSLPTLRLPCDKGYFVKKTCDGNAKNLKVWKKLFRNLFKTRQNFYFKQDSKGELLDNAELNSRYLSLKNDGYFNDNKEICEKFINEPYCEQNSLDLFRLDWCEDHIEELFSANKNKIKENLKTETKNYLSDNYEEDIVNDILDSYSEALALVDKSNVRGLTDDDRETIRGFIDGQKDKLRKNKSLYKKWEKLAYNNIFECNDFYEGLIKACTSSINSIESDENTYLEIKVDYTHSHWVTTLNRDVLRYFGLMYGPLQTLFGEKVKWIVKSGKKNCGVSPLFDIDGYVHALDDGSTPSYSNSVEANQIKFNLTFKNTVKSDDVYSCQILWSYERDSIGLNLKDDLKEICNAKYLFTNKAHQEPISKEGGLQSLSLHDVGTLQQMRCKDLGSLLYSGASDVENISSELETIIDESYFEDDSKKDVLKEKIKLFESHYLVAIEDFYNQGIVFDKSLEQAKAYSEVLKFASSGVFNNNDELRKFLKTFLKVGVIAVEGNDKLCIVAPWHPERLKALALKQQGITKFCKEVLAKGGNCVNRDLFNDSAISEFKTTLFPDLTVSQNGELLVATSMVNGYSILETPLDSGTDGELYFVNSDLGNGVNDIIEFIKTYVDLYPHLKTNLNVVLYSCSLAKMPVKLIKSIEESDKLSGFKINLVIVGDKSGQVDNIYRELIVRSDDTYQSIFNNAISDTFLSNIRVSVKTLDEVKNKSSFKPFDLCILYDVISRYASVKWEKVSGIYNIKDDEFNSSIVSRRYVNPKENKSAYQFLTSPKLSPTARAYINALKDCDESGSYMDQEGYLPVRRINIDNSQIKKIIDRVHELSEWVVFFDDLIDKNHLSNINIKVVRYKRNRLNERNIVVSSKSDMTFVEKILRTVLHNLAVRDDSIQSAIESIKQDAITLSGSVLLRASKSYNFTYEMVGLILSKRLLDYKYEQLDHKLLSDAQNKAVAYFMLDDYQTWFPTDNNMLADILSVVVYKHNGRIAVELRIIESKYITSTDLNIKKKSEEQTIASLMPFARAFLQEDRAIDCSQWEARLADLLIDSKYSDARSLDLLLEARKALLNKEYDISISAASFVFNVGDDSDNSIEVVSKDLVVDFEKDISAVQLYFNQRATRKLMEYYVDKKDISSFVNDYIEIPYLQNDTQAVNKVTTVSNELAVNEVTHTSREKAPHEESNESSEDEGEGDKVQCALSSEGSRDSNDFVQKLNKVEDFVSFQSQEDSVENTGESDGISKLEEQSQSEIIQSGLQPVEKKAFEIQNRFPPKIQALIDAHQEKEQHLSEEQEKQAKEVANNLKRALQGYGMIAKVLRYRYTPNGFSVTFAGNNTLTENSIRNKIGVLETSDSLSVTNIMPAKGEITVNVTKDERDIVSLWSLWAKTEFNRDRTGCCGSIPLALEDNNGSVLYLNILKKFEKESQHDPHSLVAGTTGSGKSVLLRTMVLDLAAMNPPDLVKFIMIDPKYGGTFNVFNSLPHMLKPTVLNEGEAAETFNFLVEEMERRYELFAKYSVSEIKDYNARSDCEKLPLIFVFHDEFADWAKTEPYKNKAIDAICRLALKSRAAGIFLVIAAQRPDKDVFKMNLRENLGNRLCLKVSDSGTSEVVLRETGAELLLGHGHLLAKLASVTHLCQCPLIENEELTELIEAIKESYS